MRIFPTWLACAALLGVDTGVSRCQDQKSAASDTDRPEAVHVGYSGGLFPTISRKDISVAVELWATQMAADQGRPMTPRITFYDDFESLIASVESGKTEVVSITSVEYLASTDRIPLEPFVVGVMGDRTEEEYVLLTNRMNRVASLSDLQGRKLIVDGGRRGKPLLMVWLETLLLRNNLGTIGSFFSRIRSADKTSQAVLAVFFGQADACLVTRRLYATSVELNPQLGKDLMVLEASPGLLPGMICFSANANESIREAMKEGIFAMSSDPRGMQILTVFGLDGFAPFAPLHLEATRQLIREHGERILQRESRPETSSGSDSSNGSGRED